MRNAGTALQFHSNGVIQGYNGIATVDAKHQVAVDARAFGDGWEAQHLEAVLDSIGERFQEIDPETDIFEEVVLTADSGFNSEDAMNVLQDRSIDGYVADRQIRTRDPRPPGQDRPCAAWVRSRPPELRASDLDLTRSLGQLRSDHDRKA